MTLRWPERHGKTELADQRRSRGSGRDPGGGEPLRNIVLSNGFCLFPLANAAAELDLTGRLAALVTGAYPNRVSGALQRVAPGFLGRKLGRLERRRTDVSPDRVISIAVPEAVYQLGRMGAAMADGTSAPAWLDIFAMRLYGAAAANALYRVGLRTGVYHYRAGFGHSSVLAAKQLGMFAAVNHSAAHPLFFDYLGANRGRFPVDGERPNVGSLSSSIWRDIDRADVIIVNSRFVLESCIRAGIDRSRLRLVYEGVDDAFLRYLRPRPEPRMTGPARFLFAGWFCVPKGAKVLLKALRHSRGSFSIRVAGDVDPQTKADLRDLLDDPRLTFLGHLPRPDLAGEYTRADALVFPSLAEGNARVVAEAMSAGCAVITTPNSADVEDGVHGRVVAPGDAEALARALDWASDRVDELHRIGAANREYATSVLTQRAYGANLIRVYDELLSSRPGLRSGQRITLPSHGPGRHLW